MYFGGRNAVVSVARHFDEFEARFLDSVIESYRIGGYGTFTQELSLGDAASAGL
jgi:hypothetical protein